MKRTNSRLIFGVLLGACAVNSLFLLPNAWKAVEAFSDTWGLSNFQRRFLQRGDWYRAVLTVENQIPRQASVRLVSPAPPWYLAYYLYPRILKKGSENLADRKKVREQYLNDWVLVYSEDTPPELTAYPPLKPGVP